MNKQLMQKYADFAVKVGVNVQPGQNFIIQCPVEGAEFARACLLCGDIYAGLQMVKIFVKKGLPFSDCDNILLEGLSEANCNEECLRLFHRIREAQKTDKSITLFPHGYSSIVRSACRLKRQKLAEETMETMRSKGMRPLEYAYFELCSVV